MRVNNSTLKRRADILDQLETIGEVYVQELSRSFKISEVTIRNDLQHLEKKGLLIKTRGGAIKKKSSNFDLGLNQKLKRNYKEKQKIGLKAIEFIHDGDTIVLDSGSTTLAIAKNLKKFKNLKVITNSLPITEEIVDFEGIEVILPGGILRKEMRSLIGPMAESNLKNYNCDIAFIGVDGIDVNFGISTPLIYEAVLNKIMIDIAKKSIVVCDSSKFKKRSFAKISDLSSINVIITDTKIDADDKSNIEQMNIELVLV